MKSHNYIFGIIQWMSKSSKRAPRKGWENYRKVWDAMCILSNSPLWSLPLDLSARKRDNFVQQKAFEGSTPAVAPKKTYLIIGNMGNHGLLSSMIYRLETWWFVQCRLLNQLKTNIEYHVLGNGEPPPKSLAFSSWVDIPISPRHVLRRSLGSPLRSYRFRWKRWRRAAWRYRGNLPVVRCRQDLSSQQMFQTAHNSNTHTGNPQNKWTVPSHKQDFCRVITNSLSWLPSPFFKTGNHQMISGPRRKKDQTAQRCSLGHWQVEAQNIISQRMSLDRMLHENAWTNPPILPNHLLRSASPVPKDLRI